MALDVIATSFFTELAANTALPIYYDNVDTPTPTENHLRPVVLPADTTSIGLVSTDQELGIFQVSIYVKKGSGEILAKTIAEQILDIFPRNTQLTGVRIDNKGSIAPSFTIDAWQVTPVSIPYQHIRG